VLNFAAFSSYDSQQYFVAWQGLIDIGNCGSSIDAIRKDGRAFTFAQPMR
jgi:hypothetical protein